MRRWTPQLLQFHAVLSQAATRAEEALGAASCPPRTPRSAPPCATPCSPAASGCARSWRWRAPRSSACRPARRSAPRRRWNACTPTAWCTTTCPAWTTTTCAAASRRCTCAGTRRRRCWRATRCRALAFEILAAPQSGIDPRVQVRLVGRLARAAGAMGMVGGQALDIAAEAAAAPLPTRRGRRPAGAEDRGADRLGGGVGRAARALGHRRRSAATAPTSASPSRSATTSSTWRATPRRPASGCARTRQRGKATFVALLGLGGGAAEGARAGGAGLRGAGALRLGRRQPAPRRPLRGRPATTEGREE